jgi:hypothetical protein
MSIGKMVNVTSSKMELTAGLGAGAINPMVNPLGLQAVKEALHWSVVQTIAFAAHRRCNG